MSDFKFADAEVKKPAVKFEEEKKEKEPDFVDDSTLVMVSRKKKGKGGKGGGGKGGGGAKGGSNWVEFNPFNSKNVDFGRLYNH